jgi:antitoxin (DNA-binding transcriptional repressor) of toxin-antitoxin stability system
MHTATMEEVQSHLPELLDRLAPGDEVVITRDGQPVAVVTKPPRISWPCQPGSAKGRSFWMAPDFDAPLDDFAEYMR